MRAEWTGNDCVLGFAKQQTHNQWCTGTNYAEFKEENQRFQRDRMIHDIIKRWIK
jgi:hypothetical protein